MKNVNLVICHESDTMRVPPPSRSMNPGELLLIDKGYGYFEVAALDAVGDVLNIAQEATIAVRTSDQFVVFASEPVGMSFQLRGVNNSDDGKKTIITVTAVWNSARGIGPLEFELVCSVVDGKLSVLAGETLPGDPHVNVDIRTSPTAAPHETPPVSPIRKRVNEAKDKRKRELDAAAAKAKPKVPPKTTPVPPKSAVAPTPPIHPPEPHQHENPPHPHQQGHPHLPPEPIHPDPMLHEKEPEKSEDIPL